MVAALAQLHHRVEQVGHVTVAIGPQAEEAEIPLQDGPVVLLLDVRQLHLTVNTARCVQGFHLVAPHIYRGVGVDMKGDTHTPR